MSKLDELKRLHEAATQGPLDIAKSLIFMRNHAADFITLIEAAQHVINCRAGCITVATDIELLRDALKPFE